MTKTQTQYNNTILSPGLQHIATYQFGNIVESLRLEKSNPNPSQHAHKTCPSVPHLHHSSMFFKALFLFKIPTILTKTLR